MASYVPEPDAGSLISKVNDQTQQPKQQQAFLVIGIMTKHLLNFFEAIYRFFDRPLRAHYLSLSPIISLSKTNVQRTPLEIPNHKIKTDCVG